MGDEIMNKKGSMALRDLMFAIIIFGAILALGSLFVLDMANHYSNSGMSSDYQANGSIGTLGSSLYGNVNDSISSMTGNIDESTGTFGAITGTIKGVGAVLKSVILSPVYVGRAIGTLMVALRLPTQVATILSNLMIGIMYIIIIFVILSAVSIGGTKL